MKQTCGFEQQKLELARAKEESAAKRRKTNVSECDGSATAQAELGWACVDANLASVGGKPSVDGKPMSANLSTWGPQAEGFLRTPRNGTLSDRGTRRAPCGCKQHQQIRLWRQTGFRGTAATTKNQ